MRGLSRADPILADIIAAAKAGYFDQRAELGPSELELTPVLVLYEKMEMMSPDARRTYLDSLSRMRRETIWLSGSSIPRKVKQWLTRK